MAKKGGADRSFGRRLYELRLARGWTQKELADRAGCHSVHLSRLERGTRGATWPLLRALAEALGVSLDAFAVPPTGAPEDRPRGRPPSRRGSPKPETEDRSDG